MLSTFLLRIISFLSIKNFKGSVLCLGGMNSGLRNLPNERQRHKKHGVIEIGHAAVGVRLETGSYFRNDATARVLSTITGLDGGMNFGGCSVLLPAD